MTRLDPIHPGEVLKHDFMEPFAVVPHPCLTPSWSAQADHDGGA